MCSTTTTTTAMCVPCGGACDLGQRLLPPIEIMPGIPCSFLHDLTSIHCGIGTGTGGGSANAGLRVFAS